MMRYYCDRCGAAVDRGERIISLARHIARRRPNSWDLLDEAFATLGSEALYHEKCFIDHTSDILAQLYEGIPVEPPRKKKSDAVR